MRKDIQSINTKLSTQKITSTAHLASNAIILAEVVSLQK